MPRNSTGLYSLPLPPVVANEIIEATWANSTMNDIGQALTDSLDRNGRGGMLAPFFFADGTQTNPGGAFSNAPGTGMYRSTSLLGFSWNSALVYSYNASGVTLAAAKEVFSGTAPSVGNSLTNKTYVDALVAAVPIGNYLPLAGGAITGNLSVAGALTHAGSTVWDAANFNPATKASLNASVAFSAVASSGGVTSGGVLINADWYRLAVADTGMYSNVTATGIQFLADRISASYGGPTYFQGTTGLFTGYVYSLWSDDRLKDRTMPVQGALERIARLDAFLYKHNDLAREFGFDDDKEHIGLSAQQVQREFPQCVALAPFDTGEGGVSRSGENYLTIVYDRMVPGLVAAIKELHARVVLVEARK